MSQAEAIQSPNPSESKPVLTAERLRELLHYDTETGVWTWISACGRWGRIPAGAKAGFADTQGYWIINVDGRHYRAARLAVLYMTGEWPRGEVDHCDTDPSNDRWDNLRKATSQENKANRGLNKNNTSGFKGVSWDRHKKKWVAQTKHNYRRIFLGRFDTKEEAHAAYCSAAERYFGEYARYG